MYVRTRGVRRRNRCHEYVDIIQSHRLQQGRIIQRRPGTLGRRDQFSPEAMDG